MSFKLTSLLLLYLFLYSFSVVSVPIFRGNPFWWAKNLTKNDKILYATTAIPAIAGFYFGYTSGNEGSTFGQNLFSGSLVGGFLGFFTGIFTIPATTVYKFHKARKIYREIIKSNLSDLLRSDAKQLDIEDIRDAVDVCYVRYPLAQAFESVSEVIKDAKKAILLYQEAVDNNISFVGKSEYIVSFLSEYMTKLLLVRKIIKNQHNFNSQMMLFLQQKQVDQLGKIRDDQVFNYCRPFVLISYDSNK